MESLRGEVYQTAVHEYMHLLIRHSGGSFPLWLNEGMAELYSSMNVQGGKMRVGDLHVGRYQLLKTSKWLPMELLMEVDHQSPIYTAKGHSGIFYSQSWALAHMIMLGDKYRDKAGEFLRKVAGEEMPAAKAFQDVYGKTLFKVLKDLEDYLSANSIKIALFDYKPEKSPAPEVRPATPFESDLAVARLLSRAEDPRDAEEIFERLEAQEAANLELSEARVSLDVPQEAGGGTEAVRPRHRRRQPESKGPYAVRFPRARRIGGRVREGAEEGGGTRARRQGIAVLPRADVATKQEVWRGPQCADGYAAGAAGAGVWVP